MFLRQYFILTQKEVQQARGRELGKCHPSGEGNGRTLGGTFGRAVGQHSVLEERAEHFCLANEIGKRGAGPLAECHRFKVQSVAFYFLKYFEIRSGLETNKKACKLHPHVSMTLRW